MLSIGVDIGGTFTDFTVYDHATGEVHVEKRLTTPGRPEQAVLEGLRHLQKRLPGLVKNAQRINHASTLVTNAILERKGPPTALITTQGFRDVLETRLEYRYNVYDLFFRYPEPIVPRRHRFGVGERILSDGTVHVALDEEQLQSVISEIARQEIGAVAICFLHAYRNTVHEEAAARLVRERLPGVKLSVSHKVNPEPREYQRFSTTVLDAYVKGLVEEYLRELERGLAELGFRQGLEIMLSNGGSATGQTAREFPIQMIESGPAAGVEAAIWMCRHFGITDALSFDMGGTTAKLCILRDGTAERARTFEAARVHRFVAGSGFPVSVPVYDLVEIGAGGGSIARVDGLGLVSVGPDSAGAAPGPACYGLGGAHPTVTDADLVLGLIDPDQFLGGEMKLDAAAAQQAISREIGDPLALSTPDAAFGIYDLVNETMASAARLHIAEKGCDPTRLTMIAFGGAGPVHAIELARKLGCRRVIFPPYAGVMSSFGLLTAPPAFERMVSVKRLVSGMTTTEIDSAMAKLRREIAEVLGDDRAIEYRYVAEMWHRGQEYPIEVPFTSKEMDGGLTTVLLSGFRERYAALYGRAGDDGEIEIAALRAIGSKPAQAILNVRSPKGVQGGPLSRRRVYDVSTKSYVDVNVVRREELPMDADMPGPLVVQDRESCIVIREGDRLRARENGAIFVELPNGTLG